MTAPADAAEFRRALLAHFDANRRMLPWRTRRTPYRVLVSEFMLQQTRVDTVIPRYERWLKRFPDFGALARATADDVILAWQGLGYYARARNLHRAAREVRERYGGRLPEEPAELKTLPGVGEYTAGAVASIAFGRAVPAVDGNVRRVLARLLDLADPTPARLGREAARLVDPERPGDFNEAMMELGATICTPRAPGCNRCPVAGWCGARTAGTTGERPAPRPRRRVRRVEYAVAVVVDAAGRTLLARRPDQGLLAGMWEFPCREVEAGRGERAILEATLDIARGVLGATGRHGAAPPPRRLVAAESLPAVRHAFTHLRATYRPVVVRAPARARDGGLPPRAGDSPVRHVWVRPGGHDELALPVAQQKIAELLTRWLASTPRPGSG